MRKTVTGLLQKPPSHMHLVGICGVGMAGLAVLLRERGLRVSGCDGAPGTMAEWLSRQGITVQQGHAAQHIGEDVDWVIRSAAVPDSCPDIQQANHRGIAVSFRGEVLPQLLSEKQSIAVSGTHGKTTTSSFIAQILQQVGAEPSWCIGGAPCALGGVASWGRGDTLVVEADESDGTVALYHPDIAVVTNIEFDHMEHFASVAEFEGCFRTLVGNTSRCVVYCCDDTRAKTICSGHRNTVSFGFSEEAAVRAVDIVPTAGGQEFGLRLDGQFHGICRLSVRGRHNILNALGAIAVCRTLGVEVARICVALRDAELPARRLEIVARRAEAVVVSDYAHHPTEIAATIAAVQELAGRTPMVVFQPHRSTRTRALRGDFPSAFRGLDSIVLTPVYEASESPLAGGSIWDLYAEFRRAGSVPGSAVPRVLLAQSLEQAWGYLRHSLGPNDRLLVMGAGDVEQIGFWARESSGGTRATPFEPDMDLAGLASELTDTRIGADEPLAHRTTLGVGGSADIFADVHDVCDLARLLEWANAHKLPCHILGAGSNLLVSDCGVRGVTIKLPCLGIESIREEDGHVVVPGGTMLPVLMQWAEQQGYSGLEFLDKIPGTVGGAARMNAGALGQSLVERISWVRGIGFDGSGFELRPDALQAGYRTSAALTERIVLEVAFALDRAMPATVQERRAVVGTGRARWQGRSAGSIFKNPEDDFAGRLIEEAGFKGLQIGGARVSPEHANVIVTQEGASASDVKALMELVRIGVGAQLGVCLENELVELGI